MSQTNAETTRPVKGSEVSKLRWTWEEMKNNKTAYFMLAPFFILFIILSGLIRTYLLYSYLKAFVPFMLTYVK